MVLPWTKEVVMASDSVEPIERWDGQTTRGVEGQDPGGGSSSDPRLTVAEVEEPAREVFDGYRNALRSRPVK